MVKNWSLDLSTGKALTNQFIKNAELFVDDREKIEGSEGMIRRLQELFGEDELWFQPAFKELSGQFGYEFGDLFFTINQSSKILKYKYSIVWTSDAGQWKILSHTISS